MTTLSPCICFNSDSFLIAYYACQMAGLPVLPINTKLAPPEVEYLSSTQRQRPLYMIKGLSLDYRIFAWICTEPFWK